MDTSPAPNGSNSKQQAGQKPAAKTAVAMASGVPPGKPKAEDQSQRNADERCSHQHSAQPAMCGVVLGAEPRTRAAALDRRLRSIAEITVLPAAVLPLPQRVPGALVVFEQSPPAEVLTRRRQCELHPPRAQLGMGALDVVAIEKQIRMWLAIRNRTTWFIGLSRTEDQQQVLIRRADLDPPFVAVRVVADQFETHTGGPEVQCCLLVGYRNDDFGYSGDHSATPLDCRMLESDISKVVISVTDCILPM